MAKLIEYNVEGVEESGGGTGVKVPLGLRVARIAICEQREKKADGTPAEDIRVGLDFGPEYDWGFTYIGLGPASDWKLAEFVRAVGLKDKGKFDPAKQVNKLIRVKVNPGEYNGAYSPEMGKLFPAQPGDAIGSASESSQAGDGVAEAASNDDGAAQAGDYPDGFVPSRESDPEIGSYDDWSDEDLEAEAGDRGVTLPGGRGNKRDKLITALRAEDEEAAGGGGGDDSGDEPAAAAEGDDYDSWDFDALKNEWESRQMGDLPVYRGRGAAERVMADIIEALRADDIENPFS